MLSRLELLALIETNAAAQCPNGTDQHEENEEADDLVENLQRWRDRKFNINHTEH